MMILDCIKIRAAISLKRRKSELYVQSVCQKYSDSQNQIKTKQINKHANKHINHTDEVKPVFLPDVFFAVHDDDDGRMTNKRRR